MKQLFSPIGVSYLVQFSLFATSAKAAW